jgi:mannose-6-phosphate isomerase
LHELVVGNELPYLVKLIDTADNLSIQVHPGDEYAARVENSRGKTECWMILEAGPGAGIYLGFKEGVSHDDFYKAVKSGAEVQNLLRFYPVSPGDFFFVPAGSIHAIGAGVFLAEVQQSSGITYRAWDWNRVDQSGKPRELHLEKALDVINFDSSANRAESFCVKSGCFSNSGRNRLVNHPEFELECVVLKPGETIKIRPRKNRHASVLNLKGLIGLQSGDQRLSMKSYQAVLLPHQGPEVVMTAEEAHVSLIIS